MKRIYHEKNNNHTQGWKTIITIRRQDKKTEEKHNMVQTKQG